MVRRFKKDKSGLFIAEQEFITMLTVELAINIQTGLFLMISLLLKKRFNEFSTEIKEPIIVIMFKMFIVIDDSYHCFIRRMVDLF